MLCGLPLGLSTTFGRAAAGALASLRCVNGLHLNCLSLIAAGIATNFVYLCTSFDHLMLYGAVFGISVCEYTIFTYHISSLHLTGLNL